MKNLEVIRMDHSGQLSFGVVWIITLGKRNRRAIAFQPFTEKKFTQWMI
jgi:hypothetical protein